MGLWLGLCDSVRTQLCVFLSVFLQVNRVERVEQTRELDEGTSRNPHAGQLWKVLSGLWFNRRKGSGQDGKHKRHGWKLKALDSPVTGRSEEQGVSTWALRSRTKRWTARKEQENTSLYTWGKVLPKDTCKQVASRSEPNRSIYTQLAPKEAGAKVVTLKEEIQGWLSKGKCV